MDPRLRGDDEEFFNSLLAPPPLEDRRDISAEWWIDLADLARRAREQRRRRRQREIAQREIGRAHV